MNIGEQGEWWGSEVTDLLITNQMLTSADLSYALSAKLKQKGGMNPAPTFGSKKGDRHHSERCQPP